MTAGEMISEHFVRKESVAGNVDECGWTEEKAKQSRGKKQVELEEKRRTSKAKYDGRFSSEFPERLKSS